jgi:hypothetical protein
MLTFLSRGKFVCLQISRITELAGVGFDAYRMLLYDSIYHFDSDMTDACDYCDTIPWANLKDWRQVDEDIDHRPIVDFTQLKVETCFVCRAIEQIHDIRSSNRLTYHDADTSASLYNGYLTLGFADAKTLPLSLGVIDDTSSSSSPARKEFIDYEALGKGILGCWENRQEDHAGCRPEIKSNVHDLVVIDCETNALVVAAPDCDYLALSYVWGISTDSTEYMCLPRPTRHVSPAIHNPVNSATSATQRQMPEKVPRVVYDAVIVTKELGFRYLWIDRYCIHQQDASIKHQQIRQMWGIYASASLTLIAAAGDGPNYGLPGVSLPRRQDREKRGSVTLVNNIAIVDEICTSPWARRAWTFQENFVSHRRIVFTDRCAAYVCESYFRNDLCQISRCTAVIDYQILKTSLGADVSSLRGDEKIKGALQCLEAYCARNLTYDSDSLNAILGILVHLSRNEVNPVDHIWGALLVFDNNVSQSYKLCLHWYHPFVCRRRDGFPTWSPLAWEGTLSHTVCSKNMTTIPVSCGTRWSENDYGTTTTVTGGIYLVDEDGEKHLDTYGRERRDTHGRIQADKAGLYAPKLLRLKHARILPVSLIGSKGNVRAILQLSGPNDVILPVYWDAEPQDDGIGTVGIVVHAHGHGDMSIMLLTPVESHYERIGMVSWDYIDGTYVVQDRESGVKKLVRNSKHNPAYYPDFRKEAIRDITIG